MIEAVRIIIIVFVTLIYLNMTHKPRPTHPLPMIAPPDLGQHPNVADPLFNTCPAPTWTSKPATKISSAAKARYILLAGRVFCARLRNIDNKTRRLCI